MVSDPRNAAWDAVHEALPAGWCVGRPSFDPGTVRLDGYRGAWSVTARGPHPGRGRTPQTVTGSGETDIDALKSLNDRLRGVPRPNGGQMEYLRRRLRLAYVEGAEAWSREHVGRDLSGPELAGVISRFERR